jgi:hypothetical protein
MLSKALQIASANAGEQNLYVEDVFSTYLYTGNATARSITNGIDLAGEGGLVWFKDRTLAANNRVFDTERGYQYSLITNGTGGQTNHGSTALTGFNSDGFGLGAAVVNASGSNYASWTFRKAEKFFDVVTYTGDGTSARAISHNLGIAPGCMIVKYTSGSTSFPDWWVYHRGFATPETSRIRLNATDAVTTGTGSWGNTNPTDSVFYVGASGGVITNESGVTYVAYLFAHDAGGFGDDGEQNVISCGSYVGNDSSTGPVVTLGYEPQWIMIKNASNAADWVIQDTMRGWVNADGNNDARLFPNTSGSESTVATSEPTATGFQIKTTSSQFNTGGETYIYIAIRRPMKVPEIGTEVFDAGVRSGSSSDANTNSDILTDASIVLRRDSSSEYNSFQSRLTGNFTLRTNATNAENTGLVRGWDTMTGFIVTGSNGAANTGSLIDYSFRRAPGFFDVVTYTGTSPGGVGTQVISHNLGVPPEMIIFKSRSATEGWGVLNTYLPLVSGLGQGGYVNETSAFGAAGWWGSPYVAPTSSDFLVRGFPNALGANYIAYLFATCPNVSKVGSYTGNGSSQTINCGFTSGSRFIMIKRTDSTGDWYVWDSARGIVAGNDPRLSLNSTAAEVTTDDSVDTDNSGFVVNQVAATNVNVNAATYIFLAIA